MMALGESYRDFWYEDVEITQMYLKMRDHQNELLNQQAWLNGLYVYKGLAVVLGNMFGEKNAKKDEYPDKPFDFNARDEEKQRELDLARAEVWMHNFVGKYSKKFKE